MEYSNKEYVSLLDDLIYRDLTLETINEFGKNIILIKLKELGISEKQYICDLPFRRIEFNKEMNEYFENAILLAPFEETIDCGGGFEFHNTPIEACEIPKKKSKDSEDLNE